MKVITKIAPKPARGKGLTIVYGLHKTPAGEMLVAVTAEGLCWAGFGRAAIARLGKDFPRAELVEDAKVTAKTAAAIAKNWPKKIEAIDIPVVLYGTAFQLKVWKELLKIKTGDVTSYAAIAKKIGAPNASRAVGSAVGKNPVSLVVPCHRVVNQQAGVSNYGWGVALKKKLLLAEGAPLVL